MARVFITGSSDGLGRMAAQLLVEQGHEAVCMLAAKGADKKRWPQFRGRRRWSWAI